MVFLTFLTFGHHLFSPVMTFRGSCFPSLSRTFKGPAQETLQVPPHASNPSQFDKTYHLPVKHNNDRRQLPGVHFLSSIPRVRVPHPPTQHSNRSLSPASGTEPQPQSAVPAVPPPASGRQAGNQPIHPHYRVPTEPQPADPHHTPSPAGTPPRKCHHHQPSPPRAPSSTPSSPASPPSPSPPPQPPQTPYPSPPPPTATSSSPCTSSSPRSCSPRWTCSTDGSSCGLFSMTVFRTGPATQTQGGGMGRRQSSTSSHHPSPLPRLDVSSSKATGRHRRRYRRRGGST